jgi:DNA repair ATPase RecN
VATIPELLEAYKGIQALQQASEKQQRILDANAMLLQETVEILRDLQAASRKHARAIEEIGEVTQKQGLRLAALEHARR